MNEQKAPDFVKIKVETLNNLIQYLTTKPFSEVADLISQVQQGIAPLDNVVPESDENTTPVKPKKAD